MTLLKSLFLASCALITITSYSVKSAENATHFPGVFIGYTHAQDETHFTYGVEYEYKFSSKFGIGAIVETTPDAHYKDGTSVGVLEFFYHPGSNIRVGVGLGKERVGGDHTYYKDLVRLNANYEFYVGDFGIEPTFAVDFIDGEQAYVFGIAIVRPF